MRGTIEKRCMNMKQMKRLLSLGLAFVLAFCTLSAGMVVHAGEETEEPTVASTPFASLTVGGKDITFGEEGVEYSLLDYNKNSAKVSWTLNAGWEEYNAYYYTSDDYSMKNFANGDTIKFPKGGSAEIHIDVNNGGDYRYYTVRVYNVKPKLKNGKFWVNEGASILYEGLSGNEEVVSIKSSKPKVIKVEKGQMLYLCSMYPKKAGSSKVTVVLKINGEKKTFSATYTVKKYPKVLTSLKVNGKKVDLKKNPQYAMVKVKKDKTKVEFKTAKGWKVKCSYYDEKKGKHVKVKSGGTVPTKNWASVLFEMTKGSDTIWYDLALERG